MLLSLLLSASFLLQIGAIAIDKAQPQPEKKHFVAPFSVMPHPPALPKVDLNSCPFEGCTFRKWTAQKPVKVYSTWKSTRKPITTLLTGDEVTAITGVNVVLQPGKGIFTRDSEAYGARKGDVAYMYQNCGEGAVDMWTHGRFIKCSDPNFSWKRGYGCEENCAGHYLEMGKSEWWVEVRLKNGSLGWVLVSGNFDGTDALG